MVDQEIINVVRKYMEALPAEGIHPVSAIIFGSQARGNTHEWSDIDVLIIAPEFDNKRPIPFALVKRLWSTATNTDLRIEAIPCGVEEWKSPHARPILSAAEKEGFEIAA